MADLSGYSAVKAAAAARATEPGSGLSPADRGEEALGEAPASPLPPVNKDNLQLVNKDIADIQLVSMVSMIRPIAPYRGPR